MSDGWWAGGLQQQYVESSRSGNTFLAFPLTITTHNIVLLLLLLLLL